MQRFWVSKFIQNRTKIYVYTFSLILLIDLLLDIFMCHNLLFCGTCYASNTQINSDDVLTLPKYPNSAKNIKPDFELNKYFEMIANGNTIEAEENIKKNLYKYKDVAEVYYNLGLATAFNGKYEESINYLQKSISLKANFIEPYIALSTVYITLNKIEEAINILEKALAIKPEITQKIAILFNKGVALLRKKAFLEAELCFAEVLAYDPSDYNALYKLAVSKFLQSKYDEALELLQTIEKHLPIEVGVLKCKIFAKQNIVEKAFQEAQSVKKQLHTSNLPKAVKEKILSELSRITNGK